MSEYQSFVAAAMRDGHSMKEAAAAWRAAHGSPRRNPYSPEGKLRERRNRRLRDLLSMKYPFQEALAIAKAEADVVESGVRPVRHGVSELQRRIAHHRRNPDPTLLLVLLAAAGGYWWLSRNPGLLGGGTPVVAPPGGGAQASTCSPNAPYISYQQWWVRYINGGSPAASGTSFPQVMVQDCPPALISPWLGSGAAPGFPRF